MTRQQMASPDLRPASVLLTLALALALPAVAPGDDMETFSHRDWTTVLERFVDDRGMVDYQGLSRDRAVFDRYIERVEQQSPVSHPNLFATRDHALAYYLNAYNAHVFRGVLDRGPETDSVWSGLVSGLNFFVRYRIVVGGDRTNLRNLENKVIRDGFSDARIHAALNCASIGCPRLPRHAFVAEELERQLDAAMTEWVNDPRHCRPDPARRTVALNKIFDWFEDDFLADERARGNAKPSLIAYVNRYRPASDRIPEDFAVEFMPYDKGINAQ